MRNCSFIKRFTFTTLVACTVILLMTLLFDTVQPAQAYGFTVYSYQNEEDQGAVKTTQTLYGDDEGVIEEGGEIITTDGVNAVTMSGGDNSVTNNGTITANGFAAVGIKSTGDDTDITNNGPITTGGVGVSGIISSGDGTDITNTDTIIGNYFGIKSTGTDSDVTNSGTIIASEYGIRKNGTDSTVTNSGTIESYYNGICITGENNNAINSDSGTIDAIASSPKDEPVGMMVLETNGDNNNLVNDGLIMTNAVGMKLYAKKERDSDSATAINDGTITAAGGDYGYGMWNAMSNSTAINNDTISVTGGEEFP